MKISELIFYPCSFAQCGGEMPEPSQRWALASEDEACGIQHGVWESASGELTLRFQWNETIFGLDGFAEVTNLETGEVRLLGPGTLAYFKKGSNWTWKIESHFKKLFTIVE